MMTRYTKLTLSTAVVLAISAAATAYAQPGRGGGRGDGPGHMMGPGMHGRRMCSPRAAGFAEWRIDRLERALNLTDAQRPKFEDYKTAASKAADAMRSACPADTPATGPARMDAMEKRMEAMLQAVKTVRPAFDALYASLTAEQKAAFDTGRHRHRRWRDRS